MDNLHDFFQSLLDGGILESTNTDIDTILDYFNGQGIDLTQYSVDEIKSALEYALDSGLDISDSDMASLNDMASGTERGPHGNEISFGSRICPTRHGCTGIASCDYAYGAPE